MADIEAISFMNPRQEVLDRCSRELVPLVIAANPGTPERKMCANFLQSTIVRSVTERLYIHGIQCDFLSFVQISILCF